MSAALPPSRLARLTADERATLSREMHAQSDHGLAWREKLRRYAGLYGRHLTRDAGERFGAESAAHLEWIIDAMCLSGEGIDRPDAAALNSALFAADALRSEAQRDRVQAETRALRERLLNMPVVEIASPALGTPFSPPRAVWRTESTVTKPVVIICPMHKSMNTLVLMELCRRFDVPLAGVILRKLDFSRFRQEFSRDGTRLLRKVWRKFVLRADENAAESAVSLKSVFTALSPGFNDVRDFAKQLNVPVFEVTTLVEPPAGLASGAAHTALFTGGGLIRQAMLSHFPGGVINVHMGPLPQYKGMDVVQAPILDGCFTNVGLTAHLMAPGLDEGPVLSHFTTDAQAYPSLGSLRNEISALGPLMSFDAVLGLASGRYQTVAQPEAGRQYFITHEVLNAVISDVMAARYCEPDGPSEIEALVNRVLSSL